MSLQRPRVADAGEAGSKVKPRARAGREGFFLLKVLCDSSIQAEVVVERVLRQSFRDQAGPV